MTETCHTSTRAYIYRPLSSNRCMSIARKFLNYAHIPTWLNFFCNVFVRYSSSCSTCSNNSPFSFLRPEIRFSSLLEMYSSSCSARAVWSGGRVNHGSQWEKSIDVTVMEHGSYLQSTLWKKITGSCPHPRLAVATNKGSLTHHIHRHLSQHLIIMPQDVYMTLLHLEIKFELFELRLLLGDTI